jgi:hypothetical protein
MLTEQEAKTRWCPMARVALAGGDRTNRNGTRCCIGSACMAWRWVDRGLQQHPPVPSHITDGYCGAFGRPE